MVRVGVPLECRQVVREPGRLLLAWDLSARRVTHDCIMVTVRDASEAETLRAGRRSKSHQPAESEQCCGGVAQPEWANESHR